ncbi:MAG: hypothetical protein ACRDQW_16450, partial [Haloechinothrix sp.]
ACPILGEVVRAASWEHRMGKRARDERRHVERLRRSAGGAADVADRAERGLSTLIEGVKEVAAAQGHRVRDFNVGGFERVRQRFLDRGHRWPSWCYLPVPLVGAALGEEVAIDINPSLVSPATMLAALVGAWMPGRIAVRFDADLAHALMDTPLEATIPVEVLQRLPAWGLYIDTPDLGPGTGFFVALDAGHLETRGQPPAVETDELFLAVVRDDPVPPRLMITSLWLLPGATIAESVAAQERQTAEHGTGILGSGEQRWAEVFGMPRHEAEARLLSLVLYLCSEGADTTRNDIPTGGGRARQTANRQVTVVSAGFRLGAALRLGSTGPSDPSGNTIGRRVAPHLRRAHWHHYWCGSDTHGDRHLELRWVPPVPVNADLSDKMLTVVRPAGDPQQDSRN